MPAEHAIANAQSVAVLRQHGRPLAAFVAIALFTLWGNFLEPHIPSDHVNIATMVLKEQRPDLFARDLGFADTTAFAFYTPVYRTLIARLSNVTGSLLTAPSVLTPFVVMLYLAGAYALFFSLSRNQLASCLTAILSLPKWKALVDWWGLGVPEQLLPRSVFLAAIPWLALVLAREPRVWQAAVCLFTVGVLTNFHPVSGFGFTQAVLLTLLFCDRFRPRAFLRCAVLGLFALLPVLGFAWTYWRGTQTSARTPVPYSIVADLLQHRLEGFYPIPGRLLIETALAMSVPIILGAAAFRERRQRKEMNQSDRWFVWFAVATLLVSFAGTAVIQAFAHFTRSKPVIFDQLRTVRFLYLPLFVFANYGMARLLEGPWSKRQWPLRRVLVSGVIGFCVLTVFPTRALASTVWKRMFGSGDSRESRETALKSLADWVRTNTPPEALIDFDSALFRFWSERSLVFCRKDGGILLYSGHPRLSEWHKRFLAVRQIEKVDSKAQLEFAQQYSADYLVLEPNWPSLPFAPVFENSRYRLYAIHQ